MLLMWSLVMQLQPTSQAKRKQPKGVAFFLLEGYKKDICDKVLTGFEPHNIEFYDAISF